MKKDREKAIQGRLLASGLKWLSALLVIGLLQAPLLSTAALAASDDSLVYDLEKEMKTSREQAIKQLKNLFPELSEATANDLELTSDGYWALYWLNNGKEAYAELNATTGLLERYILNNGKSETYLSDSVTRDRARDIAREFAKSSISSIKSIQLEESSSNDRYVENNMLFETISYDFSFSIKANGIKVQYSSIHVKVDGNGDILFFSGRLLQPDYPSLQTAISKEDALAKYKASNLLQLSYYPIINEVGDDIERFALGYAPSGYTLPYVDALTGHFTDRYGRELASAPTLYTSIPVTGKAFIPHTGSQLTASQAIAKLRKLVTLPAEIDSSSATLKEEAGRKFWSIDWKKETEEEYIKIEAEIDANNGQLLWYYPISHGAHEETPGASITEQQARTKAIKLINELYPDAAKSLKLVEEDSNYVYTDYASYSYTLQYMYNETPVQNYEIYLELDEKGNIVYYSAPYLKNSDVAKQLSGIKEAAISAEDAQGVYLDGMSVELTYFPYYDYDSYDNPVFKVMLIYMPVLKHSGDLVFVDSSSGALESMYMGYSIEPETDDIAEGDVYQVEARDITNHWAKEQLQVMVELGVLVPDERDLVYPDQALTLGAWVDMVYRGVFRDMSYQFWYEYGLDEHIEIDEHDLPSDALLYFYSRGWLAFGEHDLDQLLTREQMAELVVTMYGYSKLAAYLQNDHEVVSLQDANEITNKGAVSLVLKLGLLEAENGFFDPEGHITVAEASVMMLKLAALQGKLDRLIE